MSATISAKSVASPSRPLQLTLPVPPSANRYWRSVNGHPVKSREAREYRARVQLAVMRATFGSLTSHQVIDAASPMAVTIRWYRAAKMGDLDNRLKVLLDALNGTAYGDDSQIVELHAYRAEDKKNPRVEVTVEAAT